MKTLALAACAVLIASVPSYSQQASSTRTFVMQVPPGFSTQMDTCPVSMHADHQHDGGMLAVRKGPDAAPPTMPSQHIRLVLKDKRQDKQIASARITALGFSSRGRMLSTSENDPLAPDLRRTLTVTFAPGEDGAAVSNVVLPAFTAVASIRLDSITYSDKSVWEVAAQNGCQVQPDPFMLIAAGR